MKRAVRRALLLSALAAPSALYALGLGEIRLNSALNQPFDAEIELVSATSEDLGALRAALASGDTFQRYGLDKPAYLSDFTFRVARSGDRDVLRVTSPRPVTEPFVTLLVEASWPRGRLLREYTVLLDPPVFSPVPVAAAPVAAPVAAPRAASAPPVAPTRPEPRPTPVAAPAEEAVVPRASVEPGSTYHVRPNDTLWRIASAASPGPRSEVNRTMVAIYAANPGAFGGNINVLRAGSELRIPTQSDVSAISAAAASDEVARQYRQWNEGGTAGVPAAEAGGRLRLVTPEQGSATPSPNSPRCRVG
jgi:pilus assembly protein FimV